MIVAEQKPLNEIKIMLKGCSNVLAVGCGTCVTVCFAGGKQEVGILSTSLRMASDLDGAAINVDDRTRSTDAVTSGGMHADLRTVANSFGRTKGQRGVVTGLWRRGTISRPAISRQAYYACAEHQVYGLSGRTRCMGRALPGLW